MQTLPTTCVAAMDATGETGELVFGRREPATMTPENKDVAGLLPSSEGAVTDEQILACGDAVPGWYDGHDGPSMDQQILFARTVLALAAPGAAIAAREQGAEWPNDALVDACSWAKGTMARNAFRCGWKAKHDSLASRQEAPVVSGEPADIPSAKAEDRTLTNAERSMLVFLFSQMSDLSDTEWRQHGFRRSTFENLERKLFASPSGAGLGGAVASSEAVDALRAFVAVTPLPFGSVGTRDVDIASWHAAHKAASTVLASQPGCAVEGEAVRSAEAWKITTPDGSHSWFTEDAEEVAHFSLPGQGHKIERYAAQ